MAGQLLCIGFYPYDVEQLITVGRLAHERLGLTPVFLSAGPDAAASTVSKQVESAGYEALRHSFAAAEDRTLSPLARLRRHRDEYAARVDDLLKTVQPAAILSTINPPPGILLDRAERSGRPAILLQLFHWGDRRSFSDWAKAERRVWDAEQSLRTRLRRQVYRRLQRSYGLGPFPAWDLRRATVAVQGEAIRRRIIADGVPAANVVATGNPALDALWQLRRDTSGTSARLHAQLGFAADDRIITYTRGHEDRLLTVDRATKEKAQNETLEALRLAAPEARIVIKMHPKDTHADRHAVEARYPDATVVCEEVVTLELIAASEVIVSQGSTTLLYATILDRAAMSAWFWPNAEFFRRSTDWWGVHRLHTPAELTRAVQAQLGDEQYRREWKTRRQSFVEKEFLVDGQSTARVVDLIGRRLEAQRLRQ